MSTPIEKRIQLRKDAQRYKIIDTLVFSLGIILLFVTIGSLVSTILGYKTRKLDKQFIYSLVATIISLILTIIMFVASNSYTKKNEEATNEADKITE